MSERDPERDRFAGRAMRLARVGAGLSGAAATFGANALLSPGDAEARNARALREALGKLKGPLMKVAQMFATVPDLLPPEFAAELAELQSNAPAMGPAFVRRRMAAELGPDWRDRFADFDLQPAAAASLGQVHRAKALDGRPLAVKLQYPEMQSAIESDLAQLQAIMGLARRMNAAIDTREAVVEIGARLREELDYDHEARAMRLYHGFFADRDDIVAPFPDADLSTGRLLAMDWLEGQGLAAFKDADLETRNRVARLLFEAWWSPLTHIGVIHGDPHLGNYSFTPGAGRLNLLDFGCFAPWSRATAPARWRLTAPGASRTSPMTWPMCSASGRASSTDRCSTTGCARWRTGSRPGPTAGARPSRSSGRSTKRRR